MCPTGCKSGLDYRCDFFLGVHLEGCRLAAGGISLITSGKRQEKCRIKTGIETRQRN